MFKENDLKIKNTEESNNEIIIPDRLANFDFRAEAVKKLGDKKFEELEKDLKERENGFKEEELLSYLDYLQKVKWEAADLESWWMEEVHRLIPSSMKSWKIENRNKVVPSEPVKKITGGYSDQKRDYPETEDDKQFWDINYLEKKKALEQLAENGTKKSVDFVINEIKNDFEILFIYHDEVSKILQSIDKNYAAEKILSALKYDIATFPLKDTTKYLLWLFTDLIGAEIAREKINQVLTKETDQSVINNLEYARAFFTPNHDKVAMKSVQELYKKINFKAYGLNQAVNQEEIELLTGLTKEIKDKGRVLDMGCGVGRLLLAMKQAGYDITGYDLTEDHLKEIKKDDRDAKVFRGDWHNNSIKDQSFDAIYSLGRNILHDYALPNQIQLFREAARILKPGGRFIFDIPDREKGGFGQLVEGYGQAMDEQKIEEIKQAHAAGGYRQAVEDYKREMEKSGIRNYRLGTIYDSPDGINFMTRYAYSRQDIAELARLAGFKIVEKMEKELPTGKGDVNLYYVLEKV